MSTEARSRKVVTLIAGLILAAVVISLAAVSFQRKVETFNTLGFEAVPNGGGWLVTAVDGAESELAPGDQILLVNGAEGTVLELRESLHSRAESELVVMRDGELLSLAVPRPPVDVDWAYLIQALIAGLFLFIGFYTLLRNRRREGALFFAWSLLYALFFALTPAGIYDGLGRLFYGLEELARILLPALTVHFFLVFPDPLGKRGWSRKVIPFLYLPAAALAVLQGDLLLANGRWLLGVDSAREMGLITDQLNTLGLYHLVGFSLAVAAVLIYRVFTYNDWEERRQVQWIAFGLSFGYLPFLAYLVIQDLPVLHRLTQAWIGTELLQVLAVAPLALVPATFAWSILRYKLWDIDVILRDAVSYSATALLAIAGFSLINLGLSRSLPDELGLARNLVSFSAGLLFAAMVVPVRQQISTSIERLQYRGHFGRRRRLPELAEQLMQERDLDHLCASLLENLEEALELERVNLYLSRGGSLAPARPELLLPANVPFDLMGDDFWQEEVTAISGAPSPAGRTEPAQRLFAAGYRYAFPLVVRGAQVGFALASYKAESRPLNSDDLELVRVLLNQAALAIENAQLVDQLRHQLEEVGRLQRYNEGIIESSPAGTVVLDGEDHIVSVNSAFAHLARCAPDLLEGKPLAEVLPVCPLPEPGSGLMEVSYCELGGEERHLNLTTARFQSDPSRDLRILLVHDISGQVALETALKEKDRLASLGMLAAGVAHEVNTPITGISSYAQMLMEETPESDPRYALLQKVEKQTFRASRIVNSLLDFARNNQKEYRAVDLGGLIQDTLGLLKDRFAKRHIALHWQPLDEIVTIHGSEGELQQVLTNLLLNAQDAVAGRENPEVRLALSSGDGSPERPTVRITVEDNGVGIPAERLHRIFQPFFSTKLNRGGTGLGLSISYDIVRRHGGDLQVTSQAGQGTRFLIELPREVASPPSSA